MFSLATKLLLAAALIFAATAPARAGSDDGGWAYEGEEYEIALTELEDYEITLPAYRSAAELGIAGAQSKLGSMYEHGLGVPVDHIMAYMWYSLAKAQGNERAARDLDALEPEMTAAEISQARRLVTEWLEEHPD